jgi:hypothetical protein
VHALAHITGGGLTENLPRVCPRGWGRRSTLTAWALPPVFRWLADEGGLDPSEMLKTFNAGIGMVWSWTPPPPMRWKRCLSGRGRNGASHRPCRGGAGRALFRRACVTKRVGILISGGGSNMVTLVESMTGDHPARPCVVLSNNPEAGGLDRAREMGLPAVAVDHRPFGKDRAAFEAALAEALAPFRPDILCLAGFMRMNLRPDPTFHATPKLAMEAPPKRSPSP